MTKREIFHHIPTSLSFRTKPSQQAFLAPRSSRGVVEESARKSSTSASAASLPRRSCYTNSFMKLTLGHSPDPDDAFMFYALAKHLLPTPGYEFEHILQDIQTLNERATRAELDITAISIHAYAYVLRDYALLRSGASMGDNYGPMLVGKRLFTRDELRTRKIAASAFERGLICRPVAFGEANVFSPPLVFTRADVDETVDLYAASLTDVMGG